MKAYVRTHNQKSITYACKASGTCHTLCLLVKVKQTQSVKNNIPAKQANKSHTEWVMDTVKCAQGSTCTTASLNSLLVRAMSSLVRVVSSL